MAKKKTKKRSRLGFNMAEETRKLLRINPDLKGREVYARLQKKFPNETINEASAGVAFSTARRDLGLSQPSKPTRKTTKKKVVRKRKPAARGRSRGANSVGSVTFDQIQAARNFAETVGGVDQAMVALKAWQKLEPAR